MIFHIYIAYHFHKDHVRRALDELLFTGDHCNLSNLGRDPVSRGNSQAKKLHQALNWVRNDFNKKNCGFSDIVQNSPTPFLDNVPKSAVFFEVVRY